MWDAKQKINFIKYGLKCNLKKKEGATWSNYKCNKKKI